MSAKPNKHGGSGRSQGRRLKIGDGSGVLTDLGPRKNILVTLDEVSCNISKMIGGGNMSAGIRIALRQSCRIRRVSDQMLCGFCGIAYDHNDPDPPPCNLAHAL